MNGGYHVAFIVLQRFYTHSLFELNSLKNCLFFIIKYLFNYRIIFEILCNYSKHFIRAGGYLDVDFDWSMRIAFFELDQNYCFIIKNGRE